MQLLSKFYNWLSAADAMQGSNVIFVPAGREYRKQFGLQLFHEGWASTLLLSVGRFELRKFTQYSLPMTTDLVGLASCLPPRRRHFFVVLREGQVQTELVPWQQLGTWREICALAKWLRRHQAVTTLAIISSGFHLRRLRWCCKRLLPEGITARFIAAPSEPGFNRSQWWRNRSSRNLVLMEMAKMVLYPLLLWGRVGLMGNLDKPEFLVNDHGSYRRAV
jgi:hypothetical protein